MTDDDLPRDPDYDDVPEDLVLLAGLGRPVTVIEPDGVLSRRDVLVIVPGMFGHARRLADDELA